MSKSKHTPGPWAVRGSAGTSVYLLHNYGFSASGWASHNVSEAQAQADARLIAAAPDLLEVLKEATLALEGLAKGEGVFKPIEQTIKLASAAIAKVEGRS